LARGGVVSGCGTGAGVGGGGLVGGMRREGVRTATDSDPDPQRSARRVFGEAGFVSSRSRLIAGRALDVLPRLADGVYDMVVVDGNPADHVACVTAAQRLLRPGGAVVVVDCGPDVAEAVRDDEATWIPALLPTTELV